MPYFVCFFCRQLYNVTDGMKFTKPFPKRKTIQFDEIYLYLLWQRFLMSM